MSDGKIHPLSQQPLDAAAATEIAQVFKALGDQVRLRLLSRITSASSGEVCVCDISPGLDLSGPTISHHLKVLRQAGLIDGDRRGTWVWYRPNFGKLAALSALLAITAATGREAHAASVTPETNSIQEDL